MLKVCEISPEELDEFALKHPKGNIHQTSMWTDFQMKIPGRGKAVICGVKDGDNLRSVAVFVRQKLPMGLCWYFMPRGPLLGDCADFERIIEGFQEVVAKEKCVFVRVEPPCGKCSFLDKWGRNAHAHYFPEHTILVNLDQSEEDILKQMKSKGRYNIKVARKHGVKVRKSTNVGEFFKLFQETTSRDGFQGHNRKYYQSMLDALGENAVLYLAELGGNIIAGIIVTFYKDTAIYYFGASSDKHRNVMAPYLLQWEAMRDARRRGCKTYDLFGVAPEGNTKHPWFGITKFKEKFGGKRFSYTPAREKVLKPFWYRTMRLRKIVL